MFWASVWVWFGLVFKKKCCWINFNLFWYQKHVSRVKYIKVKKLLKSKTIQNRSEFIQQHYFINTNPSQTQEEAQTPFFRNQNFT